MLVPAKPLRMRGVTSSLPEGLPGLWGQASFFPRGRDALIYALRALGVREGETVVLPAYICTSVPDILQAAGFLTRFVDVGADLTMNLEWLREIKQAEKVSVFLLVDYFGFLSEENGRIAAELRRDGNLVIEDCCHSVLSAVLANRDNLPADAMIFSMRKTFPVRDGGAACVDGMGRGESDAIAGNTTPQDWKFAMRQFLEQAVFCLGWPNPYSPAVDEVRHRLRRDGRGEREADAEATGAGAMLARFLSDAAVVSRIAAARRENYQVLADKLSSMGIRPLFQILPEEVVPQVLPVIDEFGGMIRFLRKHGVGAYAWPGDELPDHVSRNPSAFQQACRLSRQVACLPVHQSINAGHREYMVELLGRWLDGKA